MTQPPSLPGTFAHLRAEKRRAFIPFLVAGYPSYEESMELALAVAQHADILELGLPFSDPVADGPLIQRASAVARKRGMDPPTYFEFVKEFMSKSMANRASQGVPVVCMTYYNLLHAPGEARFVQQAVEAGVRGLIVVDLPFEESASLQARAQAAGLSLIQLIAPSTPLPRAKKLTQAAQGFAYLVTSLGVTGARVKFDPRLKRLLGALKGRAQGEARTPLCVGFGISEPAQARMLVEAGADGIIVGSKLLQLLEGKRFPQGLRAVERFCKELRENV